MARLTRDKLGLAHLEPENQVWFQHGLRGYKDGQRIVMRVGGMKPKRSEAQNSFLWAAYYPLISAETGEPDAERLHELFKAKLLPNPPIVITLDGIEYEVPQPPRSSTTLSKREFGEFLEGINLLTGIAPPPTEGYL